jgi:hypothetical protein
MVFKIFNKCFIAIIFISLIFSFSFRPVPSFAWSNGGDYRVGGAYAKSATKKADFTSYKNFTINVLPIEVSGGYGFGTHDFILEHAIAEAIRAGADVSWINVHLAQIASSEPDYGLRNYLSRYSYDHTWSGRSGYIGGGTIQYGVGKLYKEIVSDLKKGDKKNASRRLGWLAHYIGDASMPFHNGSYWTPFANKKYIDYHNTHNTAEYAIDYYLEDSISKKPSNWTSNLRKVAKYSSALNSFTDRMTPQEKREYWFGGSTPSAKKRSASARSLAISVAANVRNKYGKGFMTAWGKVCKGMQPPPSDGSKIKDYGAATKYLVQKGPLMLKESADALGSIIYNLSVPSRRKLGIDQIKTPSLSTSLKYSKKKKTVKVTVKTRVRSKTGKGLSTVPVEIRIYKNSKKVTTVKRWTDSKGYVKYSKTFKRANKKFKISAKTKYPTTSYSKERKKTRTVKKK